MTDDQKIFRRRTGPITIFLLTTKGELPWKKAEILSINTPTIFPVLMLGIVILLSFGCDTVDNENLDKLLQAEETTDAVPSVVTETEPQVPADEPNRIRDTDVHNRRDE